MSTAASLILRNRRNYNTWVKTREIQITPNKLHGAGALVDYNPCMEKEVKHDDTRKDTYDVVPIDKDCNIGFFLNNPKPGKTSYQRESNGIVNTMLFMRLHLRKNACFNFDTSTEYPPSEPVDELPYYTGALGATSVRVVIFVDEASRGVLSPWTAGTDLHPGPFDDDVFDSFYNDSEESRYRILYDSTFVLNPLSQSVYRYTTVAGDEHPIDRVWTYTPSVSSFVDERIDLNGITTTFSKYMVADAEEYLPNTNGLQCLIRSNGQKEEEVFFGVDFRTEFVDSS